MTVPPRQPIRDPRRIRALAHPLRLELLELLTEGDLTATECAARTGESVASCAFHLKSLAKYDFVRPGERRGREKPWHLVSPGHDVRPDVDDPASLLATQEMATLAVDRETARIKRWIRQIAAEPAEWLDTSTITSSRFWATADELAEVSTRLRALVEHLAGREADPAARPAGSRPARLFGFAGVDVDVDAEGNTAAGEP